MRRIASVRSTVEATRSARIENPSVEKSSGEPETDEGISLYCIASKRHPTTMLQTAEDILTNGFRDKHFRYHAKLCEWIAPTEWVEGEAVWLTDRPTDPAGTTGVQIEVFLDLSEAEIEKYGMVRTHTMNIDFAGRPYRRKREFAIPASVLNARGRIRIMPPEEAFEKCDWRLAEAEERAELRENEGNR